ncbi:Adaptin ear-binding coat-associated protein 2 [Paramyrothecium foliicola]|nr:Adaptin ear-binding coat-associated protein 2 [Paramyrothecium foliicola]
MELLDPATGQALPSDAIQRVLFVANTVHIYNIPPLQSTRGHSASSWTEDPSRHIFTARLRVVETSYESSSSADKLKVDLVLEDPASGQLFAAAPYVAKATVEPVYDSSRFFAVSVRDPQGRKAMLGIGFEDRSDAFDLSVALQEARRGLGWEGEQSQQQAAAKKEEETKDYSLKKGETITINLGGTSFGRRRTEQQQQQSSASSSQSPVNLQAFALAPPPAAAPASSSGGFSLPPPPGSRSSQNKAPSAQDLGFDDGKFGEFS